MQYESPLPPPGIRYKILRLLPRHRLYRRMKETFLYLLKQELYKASNNTAKFITAVETYHRSAQVHLRWSSNHPGQA
jgi:hypothetical protein